MIRLWSWRCLSPSMAVLAAVLAACSAQAAPPLGADPKMAPFYESLRMKQWGGVPCCGVADCREVDSRSDGEHWWANVDKATFGKTAPGWMRIPDDMVDHKEVYPRPLRAIACWVTINNYVNGSHLTCFITPASAT